VNLSTKLAALPGSVRSGATLALLGALTGFVAGWGVFHARPAPVESYAHAARQRDSSLVLERTPDAAAKPTALIPKGGTVERIVRVKVQPNAVPVARPEQPSAPIAEVTTAPPVTVPNVPRGTLSTVDSVTCPSVDIELALVRMKDQTRRVVVSSPNGKVLGGVDIPVESAKVPPLIRWAVGPMVDPITRKIGAFLTREIGPFRAIATALPNGNGWQTGVGVALRF